jgi:hypothetical protein
MLILGMDAERKDTKVTETDKRVIAQYCNNCERLLEWPRDYHKSGTDENGEQRYRGDCLYCRRSYNRGRNALRANFNKKVDLVFQSVEQLRIALQKDEDEDDNEN